MSRACRRATTAFPRRLAQNMDGPDAVDRARATLVGLFRARGYRQLAPVEPAGHTLATGPGKRPVRVIFCVDAPKLGIKPLRDLEAFLADADTDILLVYRGAITSFARTHLARVGGDRVETFPLAHLQFDLTRHVLVPRHDEVPVRTARRMGLKPDLLPRLLPGDPVVRWYGWAPNTFVRITRTSPEGHSYHEYRVVRGA